MMTAYQKVADALLHALHGTTLEILLLDRHDQGVSTRAIANELRDLTDGAVDVSNQTVANWLADLSKEPAA